jgi:hypothetical protein
VSGAYVSALAIYAFFVWPEMLAMDPNEFADFLAGVFAPLAFLWLVLGFRQQGDELQNSAQALWLQGEELRNSVEQQRALVEVSREQLEAEFDARRQAEHEAERAAQPRLQLATSGGSYSGAVSKLGLRLYSGGPICSDLRANLTGQPQQIAPIMAEGATMDWRVVFQGGGTPEPLELIVEYTDLRSIRRRQRFHIPVGLREETGHVEFGIPSIVSIERVE